MEDNRLSEYNYSLYDHAPCGLFTFKIDGHIIHYNKTLLSWLMMTEQELATTTFAGLLNKGGKFYYQLFVLPLLRMHREVNEISFQIETPNVNFSCLFSASVAPINSNGEMLVHAVIYKVVDRKKYETELLLKKSQSDAEKQASRERLRIVAFAQSHLVRAPLANIIGLLALMKEMDMEDDMKKLNTMLQESAENLDVVIRKIVNTATDSPQPE